MPLYTSKHLGKPSKYTDPDFHHLIYYALGLAVGLYLKIRYQASTFALGSIVAVPMLVDNQPLQKLINLYVLFRF